MATYAAIFFIPTEVRNLQNVKIYLPNLTKEYLWRQRKLYPKIVQTNKRISRLPAHQIMVFNPEKSNIQIIYKFQYIQIKKQEEY